MAGDKLVIDASVAIKWYVPEAGSQEASAILDRPETLLAPDLLAAEFGNVLWKKVSAGPYWRTASWCSDGRSCTKEVRGLAGRHRAPVAPGGPGWCAGQAERQPAREG